MATVEVLAVGAPVCDQIIMVDDDFLVNVPGNKGGSAPIDFATLSNVLSKAEACQKIQCLGGSAANTINALNALGTKCAITGAVRNDEAGSLYAQRLQQKKITPYFTKSEKPTAQVISCVTPDGQRTMRCFLGACSDYNSSHLQERYFKGTKLVHFEGYALYNENGELVKNAMRMAKKAGAKISIDLASFEVVRNYHPLILSLLKDYVDIVFCNEDEAKELSSNASIEEASDLLGSYCQVAVITLGPKGCLVNSDGQRIFCPTTPVQCIDSTGAGDIFAAGFLHMFLQGYSLQECAKVGHILGRAVLQVLGAQLPDNVWKEVLNEIQLVKENKLSSPVLSQGSRPLQVRRQPVICTI